MKKSLFVLLTVCMVQSAFGLNVAVRNMSDNPIEACLVWKASKLDYVPISGTGTYAYFNTELYTVRALFIRNSVDGKNYLYSFEGKNLKGLGTISIVVGHNNHFENVYVKGNTEKVKFLGRDIDFIGTLSQSFE